MVYLSTWPPWCCARKARTSRNCVGSKKTSTDNLPQSFQQPLHFFRRVVMRQSNSQEAAVFFHVEVLGEVQRVVVSVPGEETTLAKLSSELQRRVSFDAHRDGWTALIEALRITDAIKLQPGNRQQSPDEAFHQSALMLLNGVICSEQSRATRGCRRIRVSSKIG